MPKSFLRAFLIFFLATSLCLAEEHKIHQPTLTPQNSGTRNGLIAVSPVNDRVVWASGRGGTFVVTTDGGDTWQPGVVAGAETLQFRGVQGVSDQIAYLLSIGSNPTDFRIYKTTDGGTSWTMQFENHLPPPAFYDCFALWTPERGIAHSDSVKGVFPDLRTTDGMTWESISANMPPALPGEFSFAASNTCVRTQGENNAWIATAGSSVARILATQDGGDTWNAYDTPLVSSPNAGAFTVDFRDAQHGIVGGGDLINPAKAATATSHDGGKTWTLTNKPPVTGAIFGLSYVRRHSLHHEGEDSDQGEGGDQEDGSHSVVITADTGGAAWTPDEGNIWFTLPGVNGYWAVAFASRKTGWLVGIKGQILKISFQDHED